MSGGLVKSIGKRCVEFYLRRAVGLNSPARIAAYAVRRYGKRAALIRAEDGEKVAFVELESRSREVAEELSRQGLAAGDVLAYRERNGPGYFVYRLACHRLGLRFMALADSLDEEAASACVSRAGARVYYRFGELELLPARDPDGWESAATLNLSSGSTGARPKIVGLSNGNWTESVFGYVAASEGALSGESVFLCALPLATAGSTTFLPCLLGGVTQVVVEGSPSPELLAEYIERHRVDQLYLTPQRLFELAEWCAARDRRIESLRKIITGTERAPASRLAEAISVFGPIIHVGYGMVEALPPLTMLSPKDYRKLGSVGRALGEVAIEIRDDGRIAIRSKTVGLGYLGDADESAAHFVDGAFISNDYGRIDEEGFLYVLGRKEEIVSESPRRVFAAECEEALYAVGAVRRCAVVAKGNRTVAFVSLRGAVDRASLERAARAVIDCELELVDEIQLNGLGKIDRRALAQASAGG